MIAPCRHCARLYWRYRRDHPPPHFWSVPCHDADRDGQKRSNQPRPRSPQVILFEVYEHRWTVHGTRSILAWFDCEECEALECRYSESLAFYTEHPDPPGDVDRAASRARENQRRQRQIQGASA